jgi:hypothetical protein
LLGGVHRLERSTIIHLLCNETSLKVLRE